MTTLIAADPLLNPALPIGIIATLGLMVAAGWTTKPLRNRRGQDRPPCGVEGVGRVDDPDDLFVGELALPVAHGMSDEIDRYLWRQRQPDRLERLHEAGYVAPDGGLR